MCGLRMAFVVLASLGLNGCLSSMSRGVLWFSGGFQ